LVGEANETVMTQPDVVLRNVTKQFAGVTAVDNVSLEIEDGEFFAMLGPSGCGKTTTLRMIAGFEQPTDGEILIKGQAVQGIPAYHRPVNTVFQDYALFPHMTALENVAFGLEMRGIARKEALKRAAGALEMVQLPQVGKRKPSQMSGGQQQRVALARALVNEPAVLLLDEPLGALDLKLRKAMQFELKEMQTELGITFIFVTHDQEEAMTMANRIAVMSEGKMLQVGTPTEIYETPVNRFVADFIGETNFIEGVIVEKTNRFADEIEINDETIQQGRIARIKTPDGVLIDATLIDENMKVDMSVTVALRPERIDLLPLKGKVQGAGRADVPVEKAIESIRAASNMNLVSGEVLQSVYIGTDMRYTVRVGDRTELIVRMQNYGAGNDLNLHAGEACHVVWDAENARVLTT
jgi:spermidine/putrescine transport system ATP-binding protein